MTFTSLLDADVTIITRTVVGSNAYGSPEYGETTELVKGRVWPVESLEGSEGATEAELHGVMLDASATVDPHSVLEVEGLRYEVIGPPKLFRNPRTDQAHHYEMRARRVS